LRAFARDAVSGVRHSNTPPFTPEGSPHASTFVTTHARGGARDDGVCRLKIPRAWWVAALLLVVLRTGLLVASTLHEGALVGDEPTIDEMARSVLAGQGLLHHGQPWVLRPPLWPILVAGLDALPTPDRRTVIAFQGLCDAVTALAWAWIAITVYRRRRLGAAAFLAVLLWPPFFRESRFIQSDPCYTMTLSLMTAGFLRVVLQPTFRRAILAGVLAGLAMLVRPPGLLMLGGLLLGWFAWRPRVVLRRWAVVLVLLLSVLPVLAPWTVRNAIVFHRFVPLSVGSGEQFFTGTMAETGGRFVHGVTDRRRDEVLARETARVGHPLDAFEQDRALRAAGFAEWRRAPLHCAWMIVQRAERLCFLPLRADDRPVVRFGFLAVLLVLYSLAIPQVLDAWRSDDPARGFPAVLGVAVVIGVLAHLPFYANSRYFEPMRPFVLVLAIGALSRAPRADRGGGERVSRAGYSAE
jgi:4-amino-4-deoxy-L-arabinose transferase-like glycosyltransferase